MSPHQAKAHTHDDFPDDPSKWEPLFSEDCPTLHGKLCPLCKSLDPDHGHLNKAAHLAGKFAAKMFPEGSEDARIAYEWGVLEGLWHDLGKFSEAFKKRLLGLASGVDHISAGTKHAEKKIPHLGELIAYAIAGHHRGLHNATSNHTCLASIIKKTNPPEIPDAPEILLEKNIKQLPPGLDLALKQAPNKAFIISLFTRLLFSCLVDADFLSTEAYKKPHLQACRNIAPPNVLSKISQLLQDKIDNFPKPAPHDIVNQKRAEVVQYCQAASKSDPGLFTLTVPTGGGKTLSVLKFAVEHAIHHGKHRIIYVAPFTSIIEQNAEVIRKIVAPLQSATFTPLIEHHSALDLKLESRQSKLAAENWDAPIIITTAVQFYESLYASKSSRCRKLHNIANAVVILDEAQTLPVHLLHPCLTVLQTLSDYFHTTAVLCTATQPAIQLSEDFPIGLKKIKEIIPENADLFEALKRVEIKAQGLLTDACLNEKLNAHDQVLCIVNHRKHAQALFRLLPQSDANFHLSALMCPEHRSQKLTEIKQRLKEHRPTRVVSTQLIEAGVDIDFPVVYRALAGLDSIAQAAGRCNRNGEQSSLGATYIFKPEDNRAEAYFRQTAEITEQLLDQYEDLLGKAAIHHYFDNYYYRKSAEWDREHILQNFKIFAECEPFLFNFQFKTAAKDFRLIQEGQFPILIPFDPKAIEQIERLRDPSLALNRENLRSLQRYTVNLHKKDFKKHQANFEALREGQFHTLSTKTKYDQTLGLNLDAA